MPRSVSHNSELERILRLPRRTWDLADPRTLEFVKQATAELKTPHGTETLRPTQAISLWELANNGGLFGPQRVGSGKTLTTFLAPVVLGATRPMLIIPAKLRDKTRKEFVRLAQHWRAPLNIYIESYETISRDYGAVDAVDEHGKPTHYGLIDLAAPDLIILDECHRVKTWSSAVTRKLNRYLRKHPDVKVVALSGTITRRSIRDYAHVLKWVLHDNAPVPTHYETLQDWSHALDVKVRDEERLDVGALVKLAEGLDLDTNDPIARARLGFRERLVSTPGVVAFSQAYDGASLYIAEVTPVYNSVTEDAFKRLRMHWQLPDSQTIGDGMGVWRHARELGLGFYYKFDPPPPEPWKNARADWHRACRAVLSDNRSGIDSEKHVVLHLEKPQHIGPMWVEARRAYAAWRAIRDTFKPRTVPVWLDSGPLNLCKNWAKKHKGIIWVEHTEFGRKLSEVTGCAYYGEQGKDDKGRDIDDARPKDGSIIASIRANSEGRNLQFHWNENLVTSAPTGASDWEQMLGRTHREGQVQDEVTCDVLIGCKEQLGAWIQARYEDSAYLEDGIGLPTKIRYADQQMPDADELGRRMAQSSRYW